MELSKDMKKRIVSQHKDGLGCKKIANTLKLSCSMVAIQRFNRITPLWKVGHREVFQHDNDPKHTSKMTTALLKKLRVKVMDWPSMSPDLNHTEHLWLIFKWKVEEHKVSNIHQLCDVVMEDWKMIPVATCETLVNSMTKRVKAVLENNGGHTKY